MPRVAGNRTDELILKLRNVLLSKKRRKGAVLEQISGPFRPVPVHPPQSRVEGIVCILRRHEPDTHEQPLIIDPTKPSNDVLAVVRRDDTVHVLPRDSLGFEKGVAFMVPEHGQMPARRRQLNGFDTRQRRKRCSGRRSGAWLGMHRYHAPDK